MWRDTKICSRSSSLKSQTFKLNMSFLHFSLIKTSLWCFCESGLMPLSSGLTKNLQTVDTTLLVPCSSCDFWSDTHWDVCTPFSATAIWAPTHPRGFSKRLPNDPTISPRVQWACPRKSCRVKEKEVSRHMFFVNQTLHYSQTWPADQYRVHPQRPKSFQIPLPSPLIDHISKKKLSLPPTSPHTCPSVLLHFLGKLNCLHILKL